MKLGSPPSSSAVAMVLSGFVGVGAFLYYERCKRLELEEKVAALSRVKAGSEKKKPEKGGSVAYPPGVKAVIMVSGESSQVGKSSVCLGLLGSILEQGLATPHQVAYIKPATQCEKPTLISKFCRSKGVQSVPIGPVVYFSGFTRSFVEGSQGTSEQWLDKIYQAVYTLSQGKKYVIVDGVGYPSVGSICGLSNAHIANKLSSPVLLVGKRGVGDAVDSTNRNIAYFESLGVTVLGSVFNRLSDKGYYAIDKCKKTVSTFFQKFKPEHSVYGFIPEAKELIGANEKPTKPSSEDRAPGKAKVALKASDDVKMDADDEGKASIFIKLFSEHVDLKSLLTHAENSFQGNASSNSFSPPPPAAPPVVAQAPSAEKVTPDSREEIERQAKSAGAKGGSITTTQHNKHTR